MIAVLLLLALASPSPAPATGPDLQLSACSRTNSVQEAADAEMVREARRRLTSQPSGDLRALRPDLEALLARHIGRARAELCADVIWVNSGDADDATYLQADMVGSVTKSTASTYRFEVVRDYVIDAALIAAALALDQGDREAAERWMLLAARIAPRDPVVIKMRVQSASPRPPGSAIEHLRASFASSAI